MSRTASVGAASPQYLSAYLAKRDDFRTGREGIVVTADRDMIDKYVEEAPAESEVAIIQPGEYNATFKARRRVSVPSGGESIRTMIAGWMFEGSTELVCRPSNAEAAYRLTSITNREEGPLMPGKMAIFAGTDFLGNMMIDEIITPGEEFELPFGPDNDIEVKRDDFSTPTTFKYICTQKTHHINVEFLI